MSGAEAAQASPTFISQYGPLIAALIALTGALITLLVSGRRERDRYRTQREDEYRRDQRASIASVAVSAHNFHRTTSEILKNRDWILGNQVALRQREAAADGSDAARAALDNDITVAMLLVHDRQLLNAISDLSSATEEMSIELQRIYRLWQEGKDRDTEYLVDLYDFTLSKLSSSLKDFDTAAANVNSVASERLKPTLLDN